MNFSYLKYFKDVADLQSVTKAAKNNYISQPAISYALKQIQNEVNADLIYFDPQTHTAHLTDNGKIFADTARKILSVYNDGLEKIKKNESHSDKVLSILYDESLNSIISSRIIRPFYGNAENKDIVLKMKALKPCSLIDLNPHDESYDFAISTLKSADPRMNHKVILSYGFSAAVGINSPLANQKSIRIEDLDSEQLLVPNQSISFVDRIAQKFNLQKNTIQDCQTITDLMQYINEGKGYTIVPCSFISDPGISQIEISDLSDFGKIYLNYPKQAEESEAANNFRMFCCQLQ